MGVGVPPEQLMMMSLAAADISVKWAGRHCPEEAVQNKGNVWARQGSQLNSNRKGMTEDLGASADSAAGYRNRLDTFPHRNKHVPLVRETGDDRRTNILPVEECPLVRSGYFRNINEFY